METFLVIPHLEERMEIVSQKLVQSGCCPESSHTFKDFLKDV